MASTSSQAEAALKRSNAGKDPEEIYMLTGGQIVKLKIPDVSTSLKPQYPGEWFKANPSKKPVIRVPRSALSYEDLFQSAVMEWEKGRNTKELNEFLSRYIMKHFRAETSTDWKSYGVLVAAQGQMVSPLDLFTIEHVDYTPLTDGIVSPDVNEMQLICQYLSINRVDATKTKGNYSNRILDRLEFVFCQNPFFLRKYNAPKVLQNSWMASDHTYQQLIAAVDMFFFTFSSHPYSKIRVATLSSRGKDCGALHAITDLASYIGKPPKEAMSFILDPHAKPEIIRITTEVDESGNDGSYFHYFQDLGLSQKSPFSSSMNPRVYNFTYVIGALIGDERAYNARLFNDIRLMEIMNIAAYVVSMTSIAARFKIIRGGREIMDRQAGDSDTRPDATALTIVRELNKNGGQLTNAIKDQMRLLVSLLPTMRKGSIGERVKQFFGCAPL